MSINVLIPTPLRGLTEQKDTVTVKSSTVGEMIEELGQGYPGIRERLVDEAGVIRRFVNIYVNGEDVRFLQEKDTPLKAGDEVSIVPAIAGG